MTRRYNVENKKGGTIARILIWVEKTPPAHKVGMIFIFDNSDYKFEAGKTDDADDKLISALIKKAGLKNDGLTIKRWVDPLFPSV